MDFSKICHESVRVTQIQSNVLSFTNTFLDTSMKSFLHFNWTYSVRQQSVCQPWTTGLWHWLPVSLIRPPGLLVAPGHAEATWRLGDGLAPICCCRSCGGELGSAWVAGQHTGPPWLAPVILPSHSSARDINNNSTSGFTLLSRVNPFHCSVDWCCCRGEPVSIPNPPPPLPTQIPLLLPSVFITPSHLVLLWVVFFFSATQRAHLKNFTSARSDALWHF